MRCRTSGLAAVAVLSVCVASVCVSACGRTSGSSLTISGSAVGREAQLLSAQLERFNRTHPGRPVTLRATPDAADQRHQLYVQWLNARADDPDILQLDTIWTAEFAAAGWIASLDRFSPDTGRFFPAAIGAGRWQGTLYTLPWFMDVGLLYWRTDLVDEAPRTLGDLTREAAGAIAAGRVPMGLVWQGARYEGLVTVFVEYLGAYGGSILDQRSNVTVDSAAGIRALTEMCREIREGVVPDSVLSWQEEQTRFAFQNGDAAFMRNWPYARPLLESAGESRVAGRFAVAAMPPADGGHSTAALGGSALAVNAFSDRPDEAWEVVRFLLEPEQMLERARVTGQYPPQADLYDTPELTDALGTDARAVRAILERAVARPSTPVYSELSEMLQVSLHRALAGQQAPDAALHDAARNMRALFARVGLSPEGS